MRKFKFGFRAALVFSILGFISLPLEAQGFFKKISWFAEGSILVFPEDNGTLSDPMPILPSPGLGASYPFTKYFRTEMTLDFYFTHYGYSDYLGRPIPNAIENRTSRVIGSLLAFQAVGNFDVTSFMTVRVFGGLAADLRIVLVAADLNEELDPMEDIRRQTDLVREYYWSRGRWFFPVAGTGLDFPINQRFKIGIDFRTWFPMYRFLANEDLPAIEGWRFGGGLRFSFVKQ